MSSNPGYAHGRPPDRARPFDDPRPGRGQDLAGPAVADEQDLLPVGNDNAVRPAQATHDQVDGTGARIDPVHVARADLAHGPMPLVVAADPEVRVGEPGGVATRHGGVVRAVEPLSLDTVATAACGGESATAR
jgi:hypothetical protein